MVERMAVQDLLDSRIFLAFQAGSLHRVLLHLHRHTPCRSQTCCTCSKASQGINLNLQPSFLVGIITLQLLFNASQKDDRPGLEARLVRT